RQNAPGGRRVRHLQGLATLPAASESSSRETLVRVGGLSAQPSRTHSPAKAISDRPSEMPDREAVSTMRAAAPRQNSDRNTYLQHAAREYWPHQTRREGQNRCYSWIDTHLLVCW